MIFINQVTRKLRQRRTKRRNACVVRWGNKGREYLFNNAKDLTNFPDVIIRVQKERSKGKD